MMRTVLSAAYRITLTCLLLPLTAICAPSAAGGSSGGTQTRRYQVRIDNRPAGRYELKIVQDNQRVDVLSDCLVDLRVLIFGYHYVYHGHEKWTAGHLALFESNSQEDGKPCKVVVTPAGGALTLKANDRLPATVSDTILPSSYWQLPVPAGGSGTPEFFEVDSGRTFRGNFKYLGRCPLEVAGSKQNCYHYLLTGGDSGDFLYDEQLRLVRQKFRDSGHTTVVELVGVDQS